MKIENIQSLIEEKNIYFAMIQETKTDSYFQKIVESVNTSNYRVSAIAEAQIIVIKNYEQYKRIYDGLRREISNQIDAICVKENLEVWQVMEALNV